MRPVARIAQSVEQGIENPRVLGSIPSPGTTIYEGVSLMDEANHRTLVRCRGRIAKSKKPARRLVLLNMKSVTART